MEQHKGQINNLLEDTWFFGNTLKNKSKLSKTMVRCNSDPCPSSSTNDPLKTSNNGLLRTPSLPVSLGKDVKYELGDEDEDDEEPRMGDLIRQAMPMPMSRRRLERTPSLPPCRGTSKGLSVTSDVQNGASNGRKVSVELSPFLQEKGPIGMVKLSRRASMDSSLLPPKYTTSKGTKQSGLNSKNKTLKKLEQPKKNILQQPKPETLTKSRKSPKDDLQGFKDLGFSSDDSGVGPNMTHKLPGLQRRASLDPHVSRPRRPNVSESLRKPSSLSFGPSPVPKWADHKASSAQDMKTQIKFWARAVASNVRQEC